MEKTSTGNLIDFAAKKLERESRSIAAQRDESTEILVARHECGGIVIYRSYLLSDGKGHQQMHEECRCKKCKHRFSPDFPPIRQLIERYRSGD